MSGNDEDRRRSRRLGVEDWECSDISRVPGGRTIGRSGDTVCDLHHTCGGDEKRGFLGLASKLMVMVCQWFSLKISDDYFLVWALTPRSTVW
jgi:hypothetical protein